MTKGEIIFRPIGIIHSPYQELEGMPVQPKAAVGIKGKVILDPDYQEGLNDLEGFSHAILLYYFHRAKASKMLVKPFLDDVTRGVFSTRAPSRPNGIGISVVKILAVKENLLEVENLDILDGTPLLDIKPHVPEFVGNEEVRIGWLEKRKGEIRDTVSDDRFK